MHARLHLQQACLGLLVLIPPLFAGCAEYFGDRHHMAEIVMQLSAKNLDDRDAELEKATQTVKTVAERNGLQLHSRPHSSGTTMVVVPGYESGSWPGQPDVDWNSPYTWELRIERPHDLSDIISCDLLPPKSGNVLKVLVSARSSYHTPPVAKQLLLDLHEELTAKFGRSAILKFEDLR